ncbi:MAG: hypothetical protein KFF50_15100, partial [Desulfatitalea sp.]|nr:hypothetical protein [Desulfatitalea sp.]
RWKIENETFNTLKNQGYHIEHNFGHGRKNLSNNFFVLNLLALIHPTYKSTWDCVSRRSVRIAAMGPALVTLDEIGDINNLRFTAFVRQMD